MALAAARMSGFVGWALLAMCVLMAATTVTPLPARATARYLKPGEVMFRVAVWSLVGAAATHTLGWWS